jgi:hypothetical protein
MIVEMQIHSKPQTILKQLLGHCVLSKKLKNISSVNNSSYNPIMEA